MCHAASCKSNPIQNEMNTNGYPQNHFSHANTCTGQISLVWSKFELESKVSHLWKWHQQWDITFLGNVEFCELSVHPLSYMNITSFSVHLDCWDFAKKNLELVGWISYQRLLLGCESTCLQKASTAFREPIALVHPTSRIHTVGGAEFSVRKASPFSHAWTPCVVWNEEAFFSSADTSVFAEHSDWYGISTFSEYPCINNEMLFSNGIHETSLSCKPTSLGTGAGRHCRADRSAPTSPTSPTKTGNLLPSLLCRATVSRWFCPPRRVRLLYSCSS